MNEITARLASLLGAQSLEETRMRFASMIDHTLLRPDATQEDVARLCREAIEHRFACVMVYPCHLAFARKMLEGTDVAAGVVVDFPAGLRSNDFKVRSARDVIANGAREVDFVINVPELKRAAKSEKRCRELSSQLKHLAELSRIEDRPVVLKMILECCRLTDEEKVLGCNLVKEAGFDFVKTSTGFAEGGATAHDVALMRGTVGRDMGVKAAGGIRTLADAARMIEAGANRIGASAGVKLVDGIS